MKKKKKTTTKTSGFLFNVEILCSLNLLRSHLGPANLARREIRKTTMEGHLVVGPSRMPARCRTFETC